MLELSGSSQMGGEGGCGSMNGLNTFKLVFPTRLYYVHVSPSTTNEYDYFPRSTARY